MSMPSQNGTGQPHPPLGKQPSMRRAFLKVCGGLLALLTLVVAGLLWYASTPRFAGFVKYKVVEGLENATGGRVELQSFHWSLLHLEVNARNLTIHGLEGAGQAPYLHVDRLRIRAKIISLFSPKLILSDLELDRPSFHLIVYPGGSTNQPVPRHRAESKSSPLDPIFDLQIQHTQVNDGWVLLNQRVIPLDFAADDLGAAVTYDTSGDRYLGAVQIAQMDLRRGAGVPIRGRLELELALMRNALQLKAIHFSSSASHIDASGSLTGFDHPQWKLSAKGKIDLFELSKLAGVEGLRRGNAQLNLVGQGEGPGNFSVAGNARLENASYEADGLMVRGVNATARLAVTPQQILVDGIEARLPEGGRVNAVLRLLHWQGEETSGAATRSGEPHALGSSASQRQVGSIRAKVLGIRLPSLLRIVAVPKFQNLGFDTSIDGDTKVDWTGPGSDLTIAAKVRLSAPPVPLSGQIPVSGLVDAEYFEKGGAVQIRQLEGHTPSSDLNLTGALGVYPPSGQSALEVSLSTHNLAEFDRALTDLGLTGHGRKGVSAIPIRLHGEAQFAGMLTGSLVDPDIKGRLTANNFSTDFSMAEANEVVTQLSPRESVTTAEGSYPASQAAEKTVHWDHLEGSGEYSSQLIAIHSATVRSGGATLHFHGEIHSHRIGPHRSAFDDDSTLDVTASLDRAPLGDLFGIVGQSLPISGEVATFQVHAGGMLGNLNGGGNLAIHGGEIWGEPYHSITAEMRFAGHSLNLVNLKLLQDGGSAIANGAYDLKTKQFLINLNAVNFDLAHFRHVQSAGYRLTGLLNLDAHASGTFRAPSILIGLHMKDVSWRGTPAGNIEAVVHTQGAIAYFNGHSTLSKARIEIDGQTTLRGDYPTQAKLAFAEMDIAPLLKALNVQNLTGSSWIGGTVTLTGPARDPEALSGEAEIDRFSATLEGITLKSQGPLQASYRNGTIHVVQAHIVGPDTNMEVTGTAGLMGARPMNLSASGSINMKLAETFDSDLTTSGHVDFNLQAGGTLTEPSFTGQVRLTKVAMSLNGITTGISNLNGTLVFNQDRLEVRNLEGTTGGGQLKLTGFVTYQRGIYADFTATGKSVRLRYSGLSATADTTLHLQGSPGNILLSGNVLITRFIVGRNLDFAVFTNVSGVSAPPNPTAPSNHVRLDIHVVSSPQLDFQNSYAQLAGSVDLRIRGTVAQPSVLGRISITEGNANFAGTTYQLQHGDIYFTNPVRIEPVIDLDATTRIEEYDVTVGLHGSINRLTPTFRSEPPLPQADVISLLALGRTQEEQQFYSQEASAAGTNPTTNALLGGALNATVGSRVQKLFGGGSVKIDPTYLGNLGNSTARITVQQNISRTVQLTYATNVNTTAEQLIQAQVNMTTNVSVLAVRDESGVFSLVLEIHKRLR